MGLDKGIPHSCVGKSNANSSARLWLMYLSENEKQGWERSEGRKDPKGDRDDVLMFVSPDILSSLYSPSYVPCADWSLLGYSRDFPHGKLPIAVTGLEHHDSSIAHTIGSTIRQHLRWGALPGLGGRHPEQYSI